ncbi:DUF262 domain-containing protein [Pantoea sp.]|uniref:DUF262 domain-containing protein n=1 Tax=Pantoea sp. TaxID=69393 RepID=UPI0025F2EF1D|nr:DUF262 domain-containing protein [Pantoea sp.]
MSLEEEVILSKKQIISDGYDMSVGEVMNLYRDKELVISPDYQRLFRWELSQKTRFIESLLLGIPIPPIFVHQDEDGTWELIDGLQRVSTILEFSGLLENKDTGGLVPASTLSGTQFLPSLSNKKWSDPATPENEIGKTLQLEIKRARLRVEILRKGSDPYAKYELFQRLNTGGANLSEQEVRNCIAVMLNPDLYHWLKNCSEQSAFTITTNQTDDAIEKQANMELLLKFFAYRHYPYQPGMDVHEHLDFANVELCKAGIDIKDEGKVFLDIFNLLNDALGSKAFKKWDGQDFKGKFLISLYEIITNGLQSNYDQIFAIQNPQERIDFVVEKIKKLWETEAFTKNSGAGVRGTTRLANLLPLSIEHFKV